MQETSITKTTGVIAGVGLDGLTQDETLPAL